MLFTSPDTGDWVRARRAFTASLDGRILGSHRVRPKDLGVVVDDRPQGLFSPTICVRFDTGLSSCEVHAPVRHLRIVRRGGGQPGFDSRTGLVHAARAGVILAFALPVLLFVGDYLRVHRSVDGMIGAFAIGVLDSGLQMIGYLISHPVQAVAFLLVSAVLGRFAFGR